MFSLISKLWNKSFKSQLLYGIGILITLLTLGFTYNIISYQNDFLKQTAIKELLNRSLSLAKTSKVWVMSNDYIGLEEVVNDVALYDDLVFATIINMDGKVIAHTDSSLVGKYISDSKRVAYLKELDGEVRHHKNCRRILSQNENYIDIIRPIHESQKHLGYVHMRINQTAGQEAIVRTVYQGIAFTILSILIGVLFAYLVVKGLIGSLLDLMQSVKKFHDGDKNSLADESGVQEIAKLAREFNLLTHTLNDAEDLNEKLTERLKLAFIATQDGLWDWDIKNDTIYYSSIWKNIIGYCDDELSNNTLSWESRVHPDDLNKVLHDLNEHLNGNTDEYKNEHRLLHKDGRWIWMLDRGKATFDEDGNAVRMVGTHTDITKEKNDLVQQKNILQHQAHHDALTSLPNRLLYQDRLLQAIEKAKRDKKQFAVFFIDLDRFKQINDSLGHNVGDKVLQEVSSRLMGILRKQDTLARLGGDEFSILVEDISKSRDASVLAEKVLKVLEKPMILEGHTLYVSTSIGISLYPQDNTDAMSLLKYADAAMYKAKAEGRDTYQFYSSDMTKLALEHIALESAMREGLEKEEFCVYYQLQVDAKTDKHTGMEALVRWNHPSDGLVPPGIFIPLAEETGLIIALDRWVMKTAMLQFVLWYKDGLNPGRLALNLAMKQLHQKDFLSMLTQLISQTGCKPEWLTLEVTEGQIMTDPDNAIVILREVSQMGIEVAVDDFGTGYSSLTYLKRLPIDKLKIDQSFVRDLPNDEEDITITKSIIALSKSLNLSVIAEGVETQAQRDFLLENACANIQGYFYSKPIPADEMESKLKAKTI